MDHRSKFLLGVLALAVWVGIAGLPVQTLDGGGQRLYLSSVSWIKLLFFAFAVLSLVTSRRKAHHDVGWGVTFCAGFAFVGFLCAVAPVPAWVPAISFFLSVAHGATAIFSANHPAAEAPVGIAAERPVSELEPFQRAA